MYAFYLSIYYVIDLVFVFLIQLGQSWQNGSDLGWNGWWGWQVVSDGAVTSLISNPADGDFLAFGADPVGRTLVSVAGFVPNSLLRVSFIAGGSIRTRITLNTPIARLATIVGGFIFQKRFVRYLPFSLEIECSGSFETDKGGLS